MSTTRLRDGTHAHDQRLDRLVQFDRRSRKFPVRALPVVEKKPRSYTWRCRATLDQGQEGACVGFGVTHELVARPVEVLGLTAKFAREAIYWNAQRQDEWPGGAYPGARPFYEGTSVLAGVKVAHQMGFMESYHWAFGLDDLLLGVAYAGPAVIGVNWMTGMFEPDSQNQVHATGRVEGGHCTLVNGIDVRRQMLRVHNSWGAIWGRNGEALISFADMAKLLRDGGEACFFVGRKRG